MGRFSPKIYMVFFNLHKKQLPGWHNLLLELAIPASFSTLSSTTSLLSLLQSNLLPRVLTQLRKVSYKINHLPHLLKVDDTPCNPSYTFMVDHWLDRNFPVQKHVPINIRGCLWKELCRCRSKFFGYVLAQIATLSYSRYIMGIAKLHLHWQNTSSGGFDLSPTQWTLLQAERSGWLSWSKGQVDYTTPTSSCCLTVSTLWMAG